MIIERIRRQKLRKEVRKDIGSKLGGLMANKKYKPNANFKTHLDDNSKFAFDSHGFVIDKNSKESRDASKALRIGKFGVLDVHPKTDLTLQPKRKHVSRSKL